MNDCLDSINALPPEGLHFEWVPAEPAPGPSEADAERFARETRLYWSGRPDPVQRQILRAFNVAAKEIGLVPRSAFSPEYRRRQRARVKRGQR